jgi:hypothetical protein
MISIGHRTRLFDVMASLTPSTSQHIAEAAGLAERYVREWLAAMTTARIVQYDVRTGTYFLPIEYAAVLSRGAGSGNLAPAAQLLSMLATVEDMVIAGFHGGGGVMPEAYGKLHAFLADEKRQLVDEDYVEALLELMPGVDLRLAAGACVLDVGCGDGAVLITLARMFLRPHSAATTSRRTRSIARTSAWRKRDCRTSSSRWATSHRSTSRGVRSDPRAGIDSRAGVPASVLRNVATRSSATACS